LISFDDQELATLRTAAAKLLPEQRDRFLKDVARELGRCRETGPDTVAQVATAVQRRLANSPAILAEDLTSAIARGSDAAARSTP
jgi:hypothetical protein